MRTDFQITSHGVGKLHCCKWMPDGQVKGVLQIVHGIAEYIERYDAFAEFLCSNGIAVVAEDHMGHGQSVSDNGITGYFQGGWFTAVADTVELLKNTKQEYPNVPYVLFGHSMGSFMARTILCQYPGIGIDAAVICGTGWQPRLVLAAGIGICQMFCSKVGEKNPSQKLQNFVFGSYNAKVDSPRTEYDWLTHDEKIVDAYVAHPMCGFIPTTGLLRDMMTGIRFIEMPNNLKAMNKDIPVLFIAGEEDPVGNYGKGVRQAYNAFIKYGVKDVGIKLYPQGRHEILNELNREEVMSDILLFIREKLSLSH